LEMNNVQDGTWHGRGDTICVGSYSEGNKVFLELHPPPAVTTSSPDVCSMQKNTNVSDQPSTWDVWAWETLISESTCYELPHDLFPEEKGDMQAISPNLVYKKNQRAAWSICCLYSDCCVFKSGKITCLWESDEEDVCSPCRQRRWTLSGYWLDPVLCVLCLVVEVVNIVVTFVLRIWSNTIYFTLAEFDLFKFVKIKCISNLGLSSLKALSIIAYKLFN
jgi:hypothetical protein